MVRSLWLGRKQLKAYIEDEATLNKSLKEIRTILGNQLPGGNRDR
jgi:hypothetical protein